MIKHSVLPWTAVLLWMALIFFLSSQAGEQSSELSTGITALIIKTVNILFPDVALDIISFGYFVRKVAHFFAYFVLGVLVIHALRKSKHQSFFFALLISVLYAMSDEFHQLFVPGRAGQLKDVLIDSTGATVGIGIYLLVINYLYRQ